MVAKAIIFRWTDKMISQSDWYKSDRSYKAQIVTYTISWLVDSVKNTFKSNIDFRLIWDRQDVPENLQNILQKAAIKVAESIKHAPPEVRNIGEYCKKQYCYENLMKNVVIPLPENLKSLLIDSSEANQRKKEAKNIQKIDNEIDIDIKLVELMPHWNAIRDYSISNELLNTNADRAISKLVRGNINLTKSEKNALKELLASIDEIGYELPIT